MCTWTAEHPGTMYKCTLGQAAYGHCSTQTNDGMNREGDCLDPELYPYPGMPQGHSTMCCDTGTVSLSEKECGVIHGGPGENIECPERAPVVGGFCGTAKWAECDVQYTHQLWCCPIAVPAYDLIEEADYDSHYES